MLDLHKLKKKYNIRPKEIAYIGANLGQEIDELNQVFNYTKTYLFEPQKKVFENLVKNYKKFDNLEFYNIALGNEEKIEFMNISSDVSGQSSSILIPEKHLDIHPYITFNSRERINVDKFSNLGLKNVNFLNIDVQGYELEVLKGFENILNDVEYIICEVNRKELYENNVLVKDLDSYLLNYGFYRVETMWHARTIPWGDSFYTKKNNITFLNLLKSRIFNFLQSLKGYFFILGLMKRIGVIKNVK